MHVDQINPQSLLHLRALCKLDHARVARLCDISQEQVRELEEGGDAFFNSHQMRVDAAKKIEKTLNRLLPKGTPKIKVFGFGSADNFGHEQITPVAKSDIRASSSLQPKYWDTPEFFKLLAILAVVVFLLVAIAMPLLYTQTIPKL